MTQTSELIATLLVAVFALGACSADTSGTEDNAEGAAGSVAGALSGRGAAGTAGGAGLIAITGNNVGLAGMNGNNVPTGRAGRDAGGGAGAIGVAGSSGMPSQVGGRAAVGGAPSTGGAGAGGSSAESATCSVSPVNPNATRQAKNLLCYMYSQYGNHVLSGQQETSWSNPEGDISWYTNNGMKAPAIMGGDYLYPDGTTTRAIAYWNAGGITMIRYHMGAPPNSDTYENSKGSTNIDNVLKEGTAENTSFKSKLDYAAAELKQLQDANVPVLWAPFHEVQQNGWFWWSKGTGSQFVALWKYMFTYFTETKQLNNLVWLMPFSGSPSSAYYPGKETLDLAGPDTYENSQPFTSIFGSAKGVIGATVPIPLHETGLIPNPANMFPSAAPWVLFNIWATYQSDGMHNTVANIKTVYADEHTVTRDELPNLK